MTKREKRVNKIIQNPKTVTFEDLKTILLGEGFQMIQGSGSSHFTFYRNESKISIPYHRPYVKAVYIKQVIKLLE